MAKVFGTRSEYLSLQEKTNRLMSKVYLYAVILLAGFLFGYAANLLSRDQDINVKIWSFAIASAIYLVVIWQLLVRYSGTERTAGHYQRGEQGEDSVFEVLKNLPDDHYWLWRDVKANYGNIDFVLAKRNLIFSIEVKNTGGRIGFNGNKLTGGKWQTQVGDYLRQTYIKKLFLKNQLNQAFHYDVPVIPIIVFASKNVWLEFDVKKPLYNGIWVLPERMLKNFVEEYTISSSNLNMPLLEIILNKLVKNTPK